LKGSNLGARVKIADLILGVGHVLSEVRKGGVTGDGNARREKTPTDYPHIPKYAVTCGSAARLVWKREAEFVRKAK